MLRHLSEVTNHTKMKITITDMQTAWLDHILAMNNQAGPEILPLSRERLQWFMEQAGYFRVALLNDEPAGFMIALESGVQHDSPNYRWFEAHYNNFVYIDRVVVESRHRRHGIGRVLYADVQSWAELRAPVLATEVPLTPDQQVSMVFHGTYGFQEVGQLELPDQNRRVSLMIKELPDHHFIRQQGYHATA